MPEPTVASPLPIIDTHQHLWDISRQTLPWQPEGSPLTRTYTSEDYAEAIAGLNVVKSIYMEVDVVPEQQRDEADLVLEICAQGKTPMVAAVISGRPAEAGFREYITHYAHSPYVKGLRQVLHNAGNPTGYCLRPEFISGIQLLGELGLSFDMCPRAAEIPDFARLADACPDTRFILDHCGNANVQAEDRSQWERDLAEIATRPNVVCKVSGIVASAQPGAWTAADLEPIVRHVLQEFGPDRVMFGGDWPVCTLGATYREWVEALRWIVKDDPTENQRKLFHDNAARFYGLNDQ